MRSEPQPISAERQTRIDLAACYRLIYRHSMADHIYTHISARVPGGFLINPYGMTFDEVTASSLVKIDIEGQILEPNGYDVNPAGFTIHSAVHRARHDAACVLHTHTRAGMAVAATRAGLLPLSQFAMQFHDDRLAYHDYEGVALDHGERERLARDLGRRNAMILRNHGLLTVGRSVAEAFSLMLYLNRACEVQVAAQSTGAELAFPPPEVCEHTARQFDGFCGSGTTEFDLEWQAHLRALDRTDPGYGE